MKTFLQQTGSNEWVQKRAVFDSHQPASAPQESGSVAEERVKELQGKQPGELREMLKNTSINVQEKKVVVESLISKIDQSNLQPNQKTELRKDIVQALGELEKSSLDIMETVQLRFQLARLDSTPYTEAIKIVWPSSEAVKKLFSDLSAKTAEYIMLAVGFAMEMKNKVASMWEDVKSGKSFKKNQQQPNATPAQPERTPLPETITALRSITIPDAVGAKEAQGFITFTADVGGQNVTRFVNLDGSQVTVAENNTNLSENERNGLFLPKYLREHQSQLNSLFTNLELKDSDGQKKVNLVKSLIKSQKIENDKQNPTDLIKLVSDKWAQYRQAYPGIGSTDIFNGLVNPSTAQLENGIIKAFKELPAQPAPAPNTSNPGSSGSTHGAPSSG